MRNTLTVGFTLSNGASYDRYVGDCGLSGFGCDNEKCRHSVYDPNVDHTEAIERFTDQTDQKARGDVLHLRVRRFFWTALKTGR